jgi:glycosyltransferase involved in cell wall biosynthesis
VGSLQAKLLNAAGYSATFIDLPKPGATWPLWAKVLTLPVRLARYVPIVWHLRRRNFDLVHIHFVSQGFIGRFVGKPYFVHAHGHDLHTNMANPLLRWVSRLGLKHARAIFYVTPDLAQYLTEFRSKSYLLPNPLEPEFFENVQPPTGLRKVLIFTRLYPVKGPGEIFAAALVLSKSVELTAISWGPMAAGLRERFGQYVKFIDRVPHQLVAGLIDGFDAVIGQMKLGILSLSELEAMARGRPVFMRLDNSLYPDDPPPVVDVKDGEELVAAVLRLQASPGEMERVGSSGREWVARNHGVDGYLKVLRRVYEQGAPLLTRPSP